MKLFKRLTINGTPMELFQEDVRLSHNKPGRAAFVINGKPEGRIVQFSTGYQADALILFFTGIIHSVIELPGHHYRLMCRELTSALNRTLPLSLNHPTLTKTLNTISELTALDFSIPDADYSNQTIGSLHHIGHGYHLMDCLGKLFQIPAYTWYSFPDGTVFVGSRQHTPFFNKPIVIDKEWFTSHGVDKVADVPIMPRCRPGIELKDKGRLQSVNLKQTTMTLRWQ